VSFDRDSYVESRVVSRTRVISLSPAACSLPQLQNDDCVLNSAPLPNRGFVASAHPDGLKDRPETIRAMPVTASVQLETSVGSALKQRSDPVITKK
jgi:hypothetical protein